MQHFHVILQRLLKTHEWHWVPHRSSCFLEPAHPFRPVWHALHKGSGILLFHYFDQKRVANLGRVMRLINYEPGYYERWDLFRKKIDNQLTKSDWKNPALQIWHVPLHQFFRRNSCHRYRSNPFLLYLLQSMLFFCQFLQCKQGPVKFNFLKIDHENQVRTLRLSWHRWSQTIFLK